MSQIQDTSKPSAILSFKTNNNSFSSQSSFNIRRLTLLPVGFFAKFIIVFVPQIDISSSLPLLRVKFAKAFCIVSFEMLYKLQTEYTAV